MVTIDSKELSEWQAYYQIEPFGYDERIDVQAALAPYLYALRNAKKGARTKIEDFMTVRPKPKQQSPEEIMRVLKLHAESYVKKE